MIAYEGHDADEVWYQSIKGLRNETEVQSSRSGDTKELLHVMLKIRNPRQRWVTSRQPAINPAFALAEVIWILNGREDAKFLNYWNPQLPKYAGEGANYYGAYGKRLRMSFGFDQLERAYFALMHNPDSRQINLQIWDPRTDFPNPTGKAIDTDIPCNVNSLLKVRNGCLEWMQILRSNDVILGLPYNFIQFTTLQEILAGWLGLKVGSYNQLSDSLHIYTSDISKFSEDPIASHENTDRLDVSKDVSDRAFLELGKIVEDIMRLDLSEVKLTEIIATENLPQAHHNIMLILCAEVARRNEWHEMSHQIMEAVTNPALRQIWSLWEARFIESVMKKKAILT